MYVTGGRVGYVIVYNVSYSLDVESTGCDVRRDKDSLASGSESCQRRLAHGLGFSSMRSEHTSELQSQSNLVCRLLLEKKKSRSCFCFQPRNFCSPWGRAVAFPKCRAD